MCSTRISSENFKSKIPIELVSTLPLGMLNEVTNSAHVLLIPLILLLKVFGKVKNRSVPY